MRDRPRIHSNATYGIIQDAYPDCHGILFTRDPDSTGTTLMGVSIIGNVKPSDMLAPMYTAELSCRLRKHDRRS